MNLLQTTKLSLLQLRKESWELDQACSSKTIHDAGIPVKKKPSFDKCHLRIQ